MNEGVVEAILFAAGRPISMQRICELSESTPKQVEKVLASLQKKYTDSTFELVQSGTDWKFTVKKQFLPIVEKIAPDTELPRAVIETLAILSWKSPILQADLIKMRGSGAYDHLSELKAKGWVVKEKQGRSYILKLTPKFFEYFDIEGQDEIKKMVEDAQVQDKVEDKVAREKALEEAKTQKRLDELQEEGPSLDEIKDKERQGQKDFLNKFEEDLVSVTKRTDKMQDELKEFKPVEDSKED